MGVTTRGQVATGILAVVIASVLFSTGRSAWVVPFLAGTAWGMVNVTAIRRVTNHLRPDRPRQLRWLALDFLLKFPVMYLAAFFLLRGRSRETILAAAGGFALVLLAIVLRSLGSLLTSSQPLRTPGNTSASATSSLAGVFQQPPGPSQRG